MNESINKEEFEKLLSQPRLLRSLYDQGKIFCKLDDQNKIELVGTPDRHELKLDDFEEQNRNFDHIVDDKERAEAYRDLVRSLEDILRQEKESNIKNLEDNSKFIKEQQELYEKVEKELKLTHDQLLSAKELVNSLSDDKLSLKETIKKLEEQSVELNKKIIETQKLCEEIDIDKLLEKIVKYSEETSEETSNQDLNKTIDNFKSNLVALKRTQTSSKMQVEAKDIITGIPMFNGDVKQLDGFLNSCELYYDLVEDNTQKAKVLKIIKAKMTSEALTKAGPFEDDINTWVLLKKRLIERIKKPVSVEYAQEDLSQIFQKKDESIEEYGSRVKAKLRKLNEASKSLTDSKDHLKTLYKMNEKQAISKFEQNIRNQTIKVLVSAAGKSSLDDCITFAMQKELIEKSKNIKNCTICGMSNHTEETCRRKKNNGDSTRKKFHNNGGNGQQNRNTDKNNQNSDRSTKNDQKPSTSGYSSNNSRNRYNNFQRPKNGNNGNEKSNESQKNVKVVAEDESKDMATVKEVLKEAQNPKN